MISPVLLRSLLLGSLFITPVFVAVMPGKSEPGQVAQQRLTPGEPDLLIAAVRLADDERVAATINPDPVRLKALLAEELHYAHSNGTIDTKSSLIDSLVSERSDYVAIEYTKRDFVAISTEVVLMKGRALVRVGAPGQPNNVDLNYLAVWRLENGGWRFLAWQSSRNQPPVAK